jgi:hypothetical protein
MAVFAQRKNLAGVPIGACEHWRFARSAQQRVLRWHTDRTENINTIDFNNLSGVVNKRSIWCVEFAWRF